MRAKDFGDSFIWGVSTAAYQIEGGHDAFDKGASIWDEFTKQKGAIRSGHNGRIACDFHTKFKEDILLLKQMNIPNFRFSLSWPRILPEGQGKISTHGIDFYNNVIDCCLANGITPWVTLYHWDLPQALEDKGGWTNRAILGWFEDYVNICATYFGDRVKNWMVLNEPLVFTGAGYFLGVHAPGKKGLKNFLPAVHHATLCQAIGGRVLREKVSGAYIGTTFSCSQIEPASQNTKDVKAAVRVDTLLNRLFLEPLLGLGYPYASLKVLERLEEFKKPGDEDVARFDFDFVGIQNYTRELVKHSYTVPYLRAKIVAAKKRNVPITLMGWEVYPPSLYHMVSKYNGYPGIKKIIVTENGAAFEDQLKNGAVHDPERLAYVQEYLKYLRQAQIEGQKIGGYFAWTFTDNFEWAEGFYPRFGLVYTDFTSQERIIKTSGKWFSDFLKK